MPVSKHIHPGIQWHVVHAHPQKSYTQRPFNAAEFRTLRRLRTPVAVQQYLDNVNYNDEPDGSHTARSPRRVMRDGVAHCFEAAVFAASALRLQGRTPYVMQLHASGDDDHCIALFRSDEGGNKGKGGQDGGCKVSRPAGKWGAIGKSNYGGLGYREPVYRTPRELAMSYFDVYLNEYGRRSLRAYFTPFDLTKVDRYAWETAEEESPSRGNGKNGTNNKTPGHSPPGMTNGGLIQCSGDLLWLNELIVRRSRLVPLIDDSESRVLTKASPVLFASVLVGAVDPPVSEGMNKACQGIAIGGIKPGRGLSAIPCESLEHGGDDAGGGSRDVVAEPAAYIKETHRSV